MKKLIFLLFFSGLTAFTWHKYYVSVTEVYIKPDKLEIIIRIFPDDIENVITDTYHIKAGLSQKQTRKLLKDYIRSHFLIQIDNQVVDYQFDGFTQEDEFFVILLETSYRDTPHQISIKNTILQDLFEEQKNIVHFFYKDDKVSFILIKQDPVAVYKLRQD